MKQAWLVWPLMKEGGAIRKTGLPNILFLVMNKDQNMDGILLATFVKCFIATVFLPDTEWCN